MTIKKSLISLALLGMALFSVGCFEVKDDVDYPQAQFNEVLLKCAAFNAVPVSQRAQATNLHILIYVGEDRKLISLNLPVSSLESMVNLAENEGVRQGLEKDLKDDLKALEKINLPKLKDQVLALGPGLLLEVQVEENNQKIHILIWMD